MPDLRPVTVRSAIDETSDRLLTAIALGEFTVGDRLPSERELAIVMGVSRPTVRSAVGRLQELGHLEVVRGRAGGHFVRQGVRGASDDAVRRTIVPRWEHTRELLDTRCLIEGLIARTAAIRHTPDDLDTIRAAVRDHREAEGADATRRTDAALHAAISRAARNDQLAIYSASLLAEITAGLPIEPFRGTYVERARTDHAALLDALADRDAERAADVATSHFAITADALDDIVRAARDSAARDPELEATHLDAPPAPGQKPDTPPIRRYA